MANQLRGFVVRVAAKVNVYQLMALALALGTAIMTKPGGGGGGVY
jgi:hypothetical protein